MMKKLISLFGIILSYLTFPFPALAATSGDITKYTNDTLNIITLIATSAAVLFLVKGGYHYFTSTGRPEALEHAKKTIRNALMGLTIVLAAGVIISVFQNALSNPSSNTTTSGINLNALDTVTPSEGLTQVLIDAVTGFLQNIVESATKPITDAIFGFVTSTPNLLTNSVVFNFWLITLGITDSLFVLVIALLGLHFMSASTLGFDEVELKTILPRVGLAFLGANISLFLADYVIITCNSLVKGILDLTGGLNQAWITNAITLPNLISNTTPLITLIFLVLFLIVSIVLLLFYISRLIIISLGAVLAPFIFLLWAIPKTADFAEIAVKSYIVTVFTVFVHVVIIQLAASFLTLPGNSNNGLISIAVAIGLFFTLLKTPSMMMQMVMFSSRNGTFKKLGGQIINVITTDKNVGVQRASAATDTAVKASRKVVKI